ERKSDVRYQSRSLREAIGFGFVLIQFSFELSKVAIIGQLHVPHCRYCGLVQFHCQRNGDRGSDGIVFGSDEIGRPLIRELNLQIDS
ncbi:MAG: hypothetical protein ACI93T_003948, partial [Porticoccaceae bacterium]